MQAHGWARRGARGSISGTRCGRGQRQCRPKEGSVGVARNYVAHDENGPRLPMHCRCTCQRPCGSPAQPAHSTARGPASAAPPPDGARSQSTPEPTSACVQEKVSAPRGAGATCRRPKRPRGTGPAQDACLQMHHARPLVKGECRECECLAQLPHSCHLLINAFGTGATTRSTRACGCAARGYGGQAALGGDDGR